MGRVEKFNYVLKVLEKEFRKYCVTPMSDYKTYFLI